MWTDVCSVCLCSFFNPYFVITMSVLWPRWWWTKPADFKWWMFSLSVIKSSCSQSFCCCRHRRNQISWTPGRNIYAITTNRCGVPWEVFAVLVWHEICCTLERFKFQHPLVCIFYFFLVKCSTLFCHCIQSRTSLSAYSLRVRPTVLATLQKVPASAGLFRWPHLAPLFCVGKARNVIFQTILRVRLGVL